MYIELTSVWNVIIKTELIYSLAESIQEWTAQINETHDNIWVKMSG